jgi:hypothetical protein
MKPEKQILKEQFIEAITEAYKPLYNILLSYENLSGEDNGLTSENFPFGMSYDEWLFEYREWVETVNKRFFPDRFDYSPTITVGDLKAILNNLDDETQIVVENQTKDGWLNIHMLELPNEDEGMFTLTLRTKGNFKTRQL